MPARIADPVVLAALLSFLTLGGRMHSIRLIARGLAPVLLAWALAGGALAQTQTYRFTNLGTLGGFQSFATGINSGGEISGYSTSGESFAPRVALWQQQGVTLTDLGLGNAFAINNATVLVGQRSVATAWVGGIATTLGGFSSGATSAGLSINDAGRIVGYSWLPDNTHPHAALWNSIGSAAVDLGAVRGVDSTARDINASGQIAGGWVTADGFNHAATWRDGVGIDLSLPGELRSFATAINDAGLIVGATLFLPNGDYHATVWDGASTRVLGDLGQLSSYAADINNRGQVVGAIGDERFSLFHAALWENGSTTPIDLNTRLRADTRAAGWVLDTASAISDDGWIVGQSHNDRLGISSQAYLLSISGEPDQFLHPMHPTLIPEPATGGLMLAGLVWLLLIRGARGTRELRQSTAGMASGRTRRSAGSSPPGQPRSV